MHALTEALGAMTDVRPVTFRFDGKALLVDAIRMVGYDPDPRMRRWQLARRVLLETLDAEPAESMVIAFAAEVLSRLDDEWEFGAGAVWCWIDAYRCGEGGR